MQLGFGTGAFFGERTDVTGSGIGPRQFGVAQDIQVNFDVTLKSLYGQYQVPILIARGAVKVSGKVGFAQIQGDQYAQIFFGGLTITGSTTSSLYEGFVVPSTSPWQVISAHAASWVDDLGVFYATAAVPFTRVTTPIVAGQYAVNSGVYSFSSLDANVPIIISYKYSASTGRQLTIVNQFTGATPTFKATFVQNASSGGGLTLTLNKCTANKLALPAKLADYMISNLEFEAMADAGGSIGLLSTVE